MMRKSVKNDEGVSAIIGVVLMVVVTVLLAAAVAAFIFSMSGHTAKPYTVGVAIKKIASGDIMITSLGGDVDKLAATNILYQPYTETEPITFAEDSTALNSVGSSVIIPASNAPEPETPTHVIVIGHFKDNQVRIIGETDV